MEKIENVPNPSLVRVPQREMVYFSNVECWYRIFISLLMLGFCCIVRYFIACMTNSNKKRGKYRKTASAIWTRRRVYWRKRRLSRAEYVVEMKSKQTAPTGVVISFENIPNPALRQRTRNDNVQGEAMNSRPLATKKSCGGGKDGKRSFDYCRRRKSCTSGQIRIRSSYDCRRAPSKQVAFFDTAKRTKKRMGYRRRCANALNLEYPSIRDASFKSKIVRNAPKRKKKARRALSPKLPEPTSTQELNHFSAPKYHISYKKALDVYKSTRKGNSFFPSRRVLWRNRHRLIRRARFNKNRVCDDYQFSSKQEKEVFCPEPPEEDENIVEYEAPQWNLTGSEYSSDPTGDGPDSSDEYDPEKDKAIKRKKQDVRKHRRLRRKRKQTDPEHRRPEFNQRSKRRKTGEENLTAQVQRKAVRHDEGDIDRKDEYKGRSRKRQAGESLVIVVRILEAKLQDVRRGILTVKMRTKDDVENVKLEMSLVIVVRI